MKRLGMIEIHLEIRFQIFFVGKHGMTIIFATFMQEKRNYSD